MVVPTGIYPAHFLCWGIEMLFLLLTVNHYKQIEDNKKSYKMETCPQPMLSKYYSRQYIRPFLLIST